MDFNALYTSFTGILNEMSPYILLGFIIAGLLHEFVDESALTRHLSGSGLKPVVKAAAIGIPLPLCSCGVLPTAVALRRQGASKAATTSFLIATPQTGVDSIAATYSLLGLPFALIRPIAALIGAIVGGAAVGRFDTRQEADQPKPATPSSDTAKTTRTLGRRLLASARYGFVDMIDSMGKWLIIGLVVATLITVFVPDSIFVGLREIPLVAMIAVVIIAVPMYVCATGSIPIAMSLMLKGLTPGVAFVLLMAGPAANFASILILDRTQGRRATAIYVAAVVATAIIFGLIIDYLLPAQWFTLPLARDIHAAHHHHHVDIFSTVCSILLAALIIFSFARNIFASRHHKHQHDMPHTDTQTYKIKGMNCAHCRAAVEKAIAQVDGVESVTVSLNDATASVTGHPEPGQIEKAVRDAGFDIG